MKEGLFKIINFFVLCLFSLSLGISEVQLSKLDFMPQIFSDCDQFCVDFSYKKKSYLSINYRASHNLILSIQSSLDNEFNSYNYIHRQYGFDYISYRKNSENLIISFKSNKSLYHDSKSFSWNQIDGIFKRKFMKFNFHLNYSTSFDKNWSSKMITSVCEYQLNEIVKVYFGLIAYFDYTDKYNGIFALSFDI